MGCRDSLRQFKRQFFIFPVYFPSIISAFLLTRILYTATAHWNTEHLEVKSLTAIGPYHSLSWLNPLFTNHAHTLPSWIYLCLLKVVLKYTLLLAENSFSGPNLFFHAYFLAVSCHISRGTNHISSPAPFKRCEALFVFCTWFWPCLLTVSVITIFDIFPNVPVCCLLTCCLYLWLRVWIFCIAPACRLSDLLLSDAVLWITLCLLSLKRLAFTSASTLASNFSHSDIWCVFPDHHTYIK